MVPSRAAVTICREDTQEIQRCGTKILDFLVLLFSSFSNYPIEMTCLLDLSHELLQSILGEVDGHDLAALSATCRAFNSFVTGNRILCKSVYLRAWVSEARTDLIAYITDVIDRTIQSKLSLAGRHQYATWSHYRRYWRVMTSKQRSGPICRTHTINQGSKLTHGSESRSTGQHHLSHRS